MISVVFSTRNGEKRLTRTMNSLVEMDYVLPWQLVVVDNNSTDNTVELLKTYQSSLPLTLLSESKPGKNNALNTAIASIQGDVVVFTDDDVRVEKDWLTQIEDVVDTQPNYDIFAGKILPEWEQTPEEWLINWAPLGHLYAIKETFQEGACKGGDVWGPNMVVRNTVLQSPENRFDPSIGPNGTDNYPMGSETEFTSRMERRGHKCWQSPKFIVNHWIPKSSLTKDWIFSRAFRLGKGVTFAKLRDPTATVPKSEYWRSLFYSYIPSQLAILIWSKKTFWLHYKSMYASGVLKALSLSK